MLYKNIFFNILNIHIYSFDNNYYLYNILNYNINYYPIVHSYYEYYYLKKLNFNLFHLYYIY